MIDMKIAAITMVYNEPEYLPIWLKYYSSQLGSENCFVVDHGSDDGSVRNLSHPSTFYLPRTPQDEVKRVESISKIAGMLLNYYDFVIYTDVDEIVVAAPWQYKGLHDLCAKVDADVISAVGLNVHQIIDEDQDLDLSRPVTNQRRWVRFVSPMCKPLITRVPLNWGRGFHSCDRASTFANVFLFHLRYFDLKTGLRRLNQTRTLARATSRDEAAAGHQRIGDDEFSGMMRSTSGMSKLRPETFSITEEPIKSLLDKVIASEGKVDVRGNSLWRIPDEFLGIF
jgi:glycosyltransferase involved in cell wall biosynthesis